MSTATVPEARKGYFPHWKLKTTGVIMPEERLPWGQTIVSGMQHGVAMAGGTIVAPLIMGFDPNRALLFSGVGTLIFFVVVAGRTELLGLQLLVRRRGHRRKRVFRPWAKPQPRCCARRHHCGGCAVRR